MGLALLLSAAAALMVLPGAACDVPSVPNGTEDRDSVEVFVSVNAVVLAPGDTLLLEAWGRRVRTDPTARYPDAEFTSLTPEVATVDEEGRVIARALGTAAIEARVDHEADTAWVAVRDPEAAPRTRWRVVDVGRHTACGIDDQDRLYCWGSGFWGELGTGDRRVFTRTLAPQPVAHSGRFADVSVGGGHVCALTVDAAVYCWGSNVVGQLGIGASSAPIPVPVAVSMGEAVEVVAGANFSCALDAGGRRLCWGSNSWGQLGLGTAGSHQPTPTVGSDPAALVDISANAGSYHACGLDASGAAYCWGGNSFGAVGIGAADPTGVTEPTPVAGDLTFSDLEAGADNSCGVAEDGLTYCWGFSGPTFLTWEDAPLIVYAPEVSDSAASFVELTVGAGRCGLTEAGEAHCWGWNHEGQLGTGELNSACGTQYPECSPTPVPVAGGHAWSMLSTGYESTCGITTDGALFCWGSNQTGQLGTGDPMERSWTPVRAADPVIWP